MLYTATSDYTVTSSHCIEFANTRSLVERLPHWSRALLRLEVMSLVLSLKSAVVC